MSRSMTIVAVVASLLLFGGCGEYARITAELQRLQRTHASPDEVRAAMLSFNAGNGTQVQRGEAEHLISQFCDEQNRSKGIQLVERHRKMLFFTTPDMTIFAFFDANDGFIDFVSGTQ